MSIESLYRLFRLRAPCIVATVACAALPGIANAQASFDIVGIKPGMTEAQAMAALAAHRPGMRTSKRSMAYTFSDGAQQQKTAEFLHEVTVTFDDAQGREDFQLYFSPPPGDPRVVGVNRQMSLKAPPTQAQLTAQLSQKYGAPTTSGKSNAMFNLVWGEAGKPMCWRSTPKMTSIGAGDASDIVGLLQRGQARGWAPRDFSQCGVAVAASLAGEPVHNLRVRMTDYAAWATTQQKASAWVEQQRQEAVKARMGKGAGPKL